MKIKVINLNIWFGGKLHEAILAFLKKEKPDVLLLQEVYQNDVSKPDKRFQFISYLNEELSLPNLFFSPEFESVAHQAIFGNAILTKFPIIDPRTKHFKGKYEIIDDRRWTEFSSCPRNIQACQLKINTSIVNIFNIHGIWHKSTDTIPDRQAMMKTVISLVENKNNVILAGDFNVDVRSETIYVIGQKLKNIFKNEITTSFNVKRKLEKTIVDKLIVDFIFASQDLKIINHYCPPADISDHLPLVVIFEIS